ncbi:MAG: DUF2066 domain-containing protein [Lactobacillales bacterium]|jgi:hypothetical protein|nr:DUF2066 domain-containing protein [Lactobacillales bacterium]
MQKSFWMLFLMLFLSMPARADLYFVPGIAISAEGQTAVQAREEAMLEGQMTAFIRLLEKLTLPVERQNIPEVTKEGVQEFVKDVSIAGEKATAKKYMGVLSVRFDPKKVQAFLEANQVPYLTAQPPKMLLIPVYKTTAAEWALEDANPLYKVVREGLPETQLYEFAVPSGDLEEMSIVHPSVSTESDLSYLDPLLSKYGVRYALILTVTQIDNKFYVQLRAYPKTEYAVADLFLESAVQRGSLDQNLKGLLSQTFVKMENTWRAAKTNMLDAPSVYVFEVPLKRLSDWNLMKDKLDKLTFLEAYALKGMQRETVLVDVHYKGTIEDLVAKLRNRGVYVVSGTKGFQLMLENPALIYKTGETE